MNKRIKGLKDTVRGMTHDDKCPGGLGQVLHEMLGMIDALQQPQKLSIDCSLMTEADHEALRKKFEDYAIRQEEAEYIAFEDLEEGKYYRIYGKDGHIPAYDLYGKPCFHETTLSGGEKIFRIEGKANLFTKEANIQFKLHKKDQE